MARTMVKLAILLLIAHALYRFLPIYFHYQQFRDAVRETALFSRERTDAQIVDRVIELADKYQIPLTRDDVQVRHQGEHTSVAASYVESIEWLPTYKRAWQFTIDEDAVIVGR